ncbi:beta-galactosidase [candidate division KSB1 bacterium]|nr:beta-galactosidase [candidate division KSB1 bacterium]
MNRFLQDGYIPFGSQYYRAPSPSPDGWERDLQNMADLGFNMVKFWVQWRWNHPAEDEFYFDDIDRLMELASRFKLKVMLNTIFDVAPAWIYQKYADASMLTLDGRRIGPQTQPHRQIGGLGYCLNHDGLMIHFYHFLTETIRRYRDHPALAIWNVGSEPELTSSMAEMRLFADDAAKMGDMLCYCDLCRKKFRSWLAQKYGDIAELNVAWNRNYRSFSEVEIPVTRNTFNDLVDWRMFFVHVLGENVGRRFEIAVKEDDGRHPLMCHHVFVQGFPITSTANDPWNIGRYGDLHGFTQMDDPMMIDVLRSCARDKPVISAEMLMLPGYTLDLPRAVDADDVKRFIFSGVAGNLKGFVFWQYRPEILGREAPTWGLAHLNGSSTPRLEAFAACGAVLQKNNDLLLRAQPLMARAAILYSPQNQIFAWASTGNEKNATDSLRGFHRALYERNVNVDFIHAEEITSGILEQYAVLCLPFSYWLSQAECDALRDWVAAGGVLVAESHCGGWNVEKGQHRTTVPGGGLHQIFGARQAAAEGAAELVEIRLTRDLPWCGAGTTVYGSLVRETFFLEGAEPIATFAEGEPAILCASFGKGRAILLGSFLALPACRHNLQTNLDCLAGLVESVIQIDKPVVMGGCKIRVDLLQDQDEEVMLILRNLEPFSVQAGITLPVQKLPRLREQFSGEEIVPGRVEGRPFIAVQLAVKQVKVFCGVY